MAEVTLFGNEIEMNSFGNPQEFYSVKIDDSRVLTCFQNPDTRYGTLVIGTIIENEMTYGPYSVFEAVNQVIPKGLCKLDSTHYAIAYQNYTGSAWNDYTVIATLQSNGTFTYGTPVLYVDNIRSYHGTMIAMSSTTYVIINQIGLSTKPGYVQSFSVTNGDVITQGGARSRFCDSNTSASQFDLRKIDDTHFIMSFLYQALSRNRHAIQVFELDGIGFNFGTRLDFDIGGTYNSLGKLDNTHYVWNYAKVPLEGGGSSRVATVDVSTNSITLGPEYTINEYVHSYSYKTICPDDSHFIYFCSIYDYDLSFSSGKAVIGTVNKATNEIVFEDTVFFNDSTAKDWINATLIDHETFVLNYSDTDRAGNIVGVVGKMAGMISPNPLPKISSLYHLSSVKGNIRGKSKEGFIRPTISQFFTSRDFEEINSVKLLIGYTENKCVGGLATSSTPAYGSVAANAFDGSFADGAGTSWYGITWTAETESMLQYQFTSPLNIRKFVLTSIYSGGSDYVGNFTVFGSNTGAFGGEEVSIYTGDNQGGNSVHLFDHTNSYFNYRFVINTVPNPVSVPGPIVNEIQMMEGIYE